MPEQIPEQIQNISFTTWDTLVVLVVLAVVIAYSFTIGKDYVTTIIIALYMAAAGITFAPLLASLTLDVDLEPHSIKIILLIALFLITLWIISHNGYFEPYIVPSGWEVVVFSVLFTGLLLTLVVTYLPQEVIDGFAPSTRLLFANDSAATIWVLAPIGAMILIKGRT
ncbi:hypothetical protein IH979_01920 [Patescibacteria group bacterium]|nr:hypothetical protein [Patescibacteria group bacterium]